MSEKAQEVRKRRLERRFERRFEIMAYLKESSEIVFDFILNELDARTAKKNYSSVELYMFDRGTPYISHGNDCKICDGVEIGFRYHRVFLEIIADMFNAEEGYSAKIEDEVILKLIVNID